MSERSNAPIVLLICLTYLIAMAMIAASHSQVRDLQRRVGQLELKK